MKKMSKKKKKIFNIFFNISAVISVLVMLVFCFCLYKLDMIPLKFLGIIYGVVGLIYLILVLLTIPKKIKLRIKSVCFFIFLVFSLIFGFGIKYIDKTINFLDVINDELVQKEEYYVSVLEANEYQSINDLFDKKIGIYTSSEETKNKVIELLEKENVTKVEEYTDVVLMFEDLSEGKIDAVIVNNSLETLLDSDLSYMNLKLKKPNSNL